MIYLSHPFNGELKNKHKVERIIKQLMIDEPGETFVSPIHTFGFLYNKVSYEDGMVSCLDLLTHCKKMYVYGEWTDSKGCKQEVNFATALGIQIQFRG